MIKLFLLAIAPVADNASPSLPCLPVAPAMSKPTASAIGNIGLVSGTRTTAVAALSVDAGAATATPDCHFSGRWRMDTASITGISKPTVFQVRDGRFKRDDAEDIMADGRPHRVAEDGYVDEQSISVESDHFVREVDKIRGKLAYTVDYSISPDGNTLTWHVASYTSPDGKAVLSKTVQRRVGAAKKGAHLLSGTWKRIGVTADSRSDWILKLDGNRFSWRTDGGIGYDAIVGGAPVKLDGDNSGVRAQITRPRSDLIVETDLSANGTVDDTLSMQLMPDGRTLRATGIYGPRGGRRPSLCINWRNDRSSIGIGRHVKGLNEAWLLSVN